MSETPEPQPDAQEAEHEQLPPLRDQIDTIMDEFPFGELARLFKAKEWVHYNTERKINYCPSEVELRRLARRLLRSAMDSAEPATWAGTGRLTAVKINGHLALFAGFYRFGDE